MNYECQRLFVILLCLKKKKKEEDCKQRSRDPHPPSSTFTTSSPSSSPGTLSWSKLQSGVIFLSVLPESRFVPPAAHPRTHRPGCNVTQTRCSKPDHPAGKQHEEEEIDFSVCFSYLKHILPTHLITCSSQSVLLSPLFLPPAVPRAHCCGDIVSLNWAWRREGRQINVSWLELMIACIFTASFIISD